MNKKILQKLNFSKGFTLIETLVVVGVFGMIIAGATGLFMMIIRNNGKSESIMAIRQQGDNVIYKVNRKLVMSAGFLQNDTYCYNNDSENLDSIEVIKMNEDFQEDGTVSVECLNNDNNIEINDNGVETKLIDESYGLILQDCQFSCYNGTSVEFSFSLSNTSETEIDGFTSYSVMRNAQ